jgi:hypothetical protein
VVAVVVSPVLVLVAIIPPVPVTLPPAPLPVALLLLLPPPLPLALLLPPPLPLALLLLDVVPSIWHTPAKHAPPVQGVLSGFGLGAHAPFTGLQRPTSHSPTGAQITTLPPLHAPAWHVSVWVHPSPSSHAAPSAFAGVEHTPVAALQVPAVWH